MNRPEQLTDLFDRLRHTSVLSDEIFEATRQLVIARLRKRRLLGRSPAILGYPFSSWHEEGALDAIAVDALDNAVIKRTKGLEARRENGYPIDGIVVSNVDFFLMELQARADPIGRNVFKVVREASQAAMRQGVMTQSGSKDQLDEGSIMITRDGMGSRADPAPIHQVRGALVRQASFRQFMELVDRADCVDASYARAVRAFEGALQGLSSAGVKSVKFGDLVTAAKVEAKAFAGSVDPRAAEEPYPETAEQSGGNWGPLRVELTADLIAVEKAIRKSDHPGDVIATRLQVLFALVGAVRDGSTDADAARQTGLDRRRFSEHRRAIEEIARGLDNLEASDVNEGEI